VLRLRGGAGEGEEEGCLRLSQEMIMEMAGMMDNVAHHLESRVNHLTDVRMGYVVVMSTISKRKDKRSDIEAYYRNESKTFWFGPLTIGTKAKHIDFGPNNCLLRADRFRFGPKILGQSKAISFGLEIVLDKVECFYLIQKLIDQSKRF
jgi:hypothetical protein